MRGKRDMSEEAKSQQEPSMEEILASIRRIISDDDTDDVKSDDAAVEEGVEENDDVLELTDVVEDEEPVQETEPAEEEAAEVPEEEAPQSQDDIDSLFDEADSSNTDDEVELVEEEEDEPPIEVAAEVTPVVAIEGSIIDEAPATAATGSLSGLVAAVDAAHGTPIGNGNRTIEDLVKEVMRPMIKEWLDENLPALVERVVRREVERLSRTAEGEE
jgi:cell pole-organizing protein PopZ